MMVVDKERKRMLRIQEAILFKQLGIEGIPEEIPLTDLIGKGVIIE